jgi:DNA methylase
MGPRRQKKSRILQLDPAAAEQLIQAARDCNPVSGLTHNFYRYPARFSPTLVRAAIHAFTEPGDRVLDPFVGGGTTLVEALVAGRHGIGIDISSLATFVSEVKTTVYTRGELDTLREWADRATHAIDLRAPARVFAAFEEAGYLRHLDGTRTWRLRKAISQAVTSAEGLGTPRLEKFARCVVLRTAQWALDGRKVLPSVAAFRVTLREFAHEMINASNELAHATGRRPEVRINCLHRAISGLECESIFTNGPSPRLVVTSPPYPGVHVLYHRWQIHGGRETPAPFWISNRLDGDGAAYYTFGDRHARALNYFTKLQTALKSIAAVCDRDTTVVQVVAFSNPAWQLPRYLSAADDVGFEEFYVPAGDNSLVPKRLWRSVPNRKWYAEQRGRTAGSHEAVLFHRLRC